MLVDSELMNSENNDCTSSDEEDYRTEIDTDSEEHRKDHDSINNA